MLRLLAVIIIGFVSFSASAESSSFDPVASRIHTERLVGSYGSYRIAVGGTVDMDNTLTRAYDGVRIAFQNNESLTIANTGAEPVVNPRVVTNDQRRWWSLDSLLDEILEGAGDDQEKALFIYDYVRRNTYHDYPLFTGDELHDPVRYLNEFGAGFCDDAGFVGCSLFFHAGLNRAKFGRDPRVRRLAGHMMCEAAVGGGVPVPGYRPADILPRPCK